MSLFVKLVKKVLTISISAVILTSATLSYGTENSKRFLFLYTTGSSIANTSNIFTSTDPSVLSVSDIKLFQKQEPFHLKEMTAPISLFSPSKTFHAKNKQYSSEEVMPITVLGDINHPGNFIIPSNASLYTLETVHRLLDIDRFNIQITVLRKGTNLPVTEDQLHHFKLTQNDIVILKKTEREVPLVTEASHNNSLASTTNKGNQSTEDIQPETQKSSVPSGPILTPGDILIINFPGEEGFNKPFPLNRRGNIKLPEVGDIDLQHTSPEIARLRITEALSSIYRNLDELEINLHEKRLLITVSGHIKKPGEINLPETADIQTAIQTAGGSQTNAQLDKLQIRRGELIIPVNYQQYLATGDPELLPALQSLDTLFIPAGLDTDNTSNPINDKNAIRILGQVTSPGAYPFREGITIIDALLHGGGTTPVSSIENIKVITGDKSVSFNLRSYLRNGNKTELPALSKGTTIFIPKQGSSVISDSSSVYALGEISKPGRYSLAPDTTVMDIIATAGGVSSNGDISRIRLIRAEGETKRFNLQAYSIGKGPKPAPLMAGDALFIPPKIKEQPTTIISAPDEKTIRIIGAINKPGIYEWTPDSTFINLIARAGGPAEKADITQITLLDTTTEPNFRQTFNLQSFLKQGGNSNALPKLKSGLTIMIPEQASDNSNNKQWVQLPKEHAIYIMGAVVSPGRYAFDRTMTFLDILSAASGPSQEADLTKVQIVHRNDTAPRVSNFNLSLYFDTGDETLLPIIAPGDSIFIPSRNRSWTQKPREETVRIMGAVTNGGRYEFSSDMTILDLLAEAGGPTKSAYIERIVVVNASGNEKMAVTFDLIDFMKNPDTRKLPVIREGDTIFIPDIEKSRWALFMDAVKDTLNIASLVTLVRTIYKGSAI
ncbi:hypothetical protein CI610_00071 [invertebrate metagenome]|uniref:Polysialic acid transport protein KpsD n=1 Tax=invertebrate metagenome TaxID=1711999 RepID=A0A2H9TCJ7_9ZZZZ